MRALRAFLFSKSQDASWSCSVFRDLEALLDATRQALANDSGGGVIHVGFWRPDTEEVANMAMGWKQLILLSESAISALPPPVDASSRPVGEVRGLRFHVALSGFGYEMDDLSDKWGIGEEKSVPTPPPRMVTDGIFGPTGWVAKLIAAKPDAEVALMDAGIYDDESFRQMESNLEAPDRLALALSRYEILTGDRPNVETILDNLHACPHWFLDSKLMHLNLTVRVGNVFRAYGMKTIGDLAIKGTNGLLKMANMGRGSTHGLAKLLRDSFVRGDMLYMKERRDASDVGDVDNVAHLEGERSPPRVTAKLHAAPVAPAPPPSSFVEGVANAAQALPRVQRDVWEIRLGFRREFQTLQQIADTIGITRERVRQIEKSAFQNVRTHPVWACLDKHLTSALEGRTSPLMLAGLSAIDPWFDGADGMDITFRQVFAELFDKEFSVIAIEGHAVLSSISGSEWGQAIEIGKTLMRDLSREKATEEYAKFHVAALLGERGAELREDLWREVSADALWVYLPGGERRLSGYGRSADTLVIAVLEEAGKPLHVREICKRACELTSRPYELLRIHNAAHNVAVLYSRGTYGLPSHCPLSKSELVQIEAEIDDIVSEGEPNRQWHTSEFLEVLLERGMDFDGRLTKYIINIALLNAPKFVYMRRMVWGLKDVWIESAASRLDVRQAVISVLESAGGPLTKEELLSKLAEGRGVGNHFQIHPAGNLIRIGQKLWGLADRDVQIQHVDTLLEKIVKRIEETQQGVHISEAKDFLPELEDGDVRTLWSIAKSRGMQVDRGQYLFPSAWADSRRVSPSEAIKKALQSLHAGGATLEAVCESVNRLTGRIVPRPLVRHMLASSDDNVFDDLTGHWTLAFHEANEDMEPETQ